jgi:hypothetical protein
MSTEARKKRKRAPRLAPEPPTTNKRQAWNQTLAEVREFIRYSDLTSDDTKQRCVDLDEREENILRREQMVDHTYAEEREKLSATRKRLTKQETKMDRREAYVQALEKALHNAGISLPSGFSK